MYRRFKLSGYPKCSRLFWSQAKRAQAVAPDTKTIAGALDAIGQWSANYRNEQGGRNEQIESENKRRSELV